MNTNKNILLSKYESARIKFKPDIIQTIIIAEAPPNNTNHFFYFLNQNSNDFLFIGITNTLYPELKEKYIKSKRDINVKKLILEKFQSSGYFLLDLFELPLSINQDNNEMALVKLEKKLNYYSSPSSNIILVKANVYDIAYPFLQPRFNVINQRISFPSTGRQKEFKETFNKAINEIK